MSKYLIDSEFIMRVGLDLQYFKSKNRTFNFRCPLCGDSKTDRRKARGYLYSRSGDWFYKCHNCNAGMTLSSFIYNVNPSLYREYKAALFMEERGIMSCEAVEEKPVEIKPIKKNPIKVVREHLQPVIQLDDNHNAISYLEGRLVPKNRYREIYFTEDLNHLKPAFPLYDSDEYKFMKEPRLALPVLDRSKKLVGLITRSIMPDAKLRYINMKMDDTTPLLYNLQAVDINKDIRVCEGAFDSLFINNAVASSNLNLKGLADYFPKEKLVLIYDNQPRHKEVLNAMEDAIDNGFRVVIWPSDILAKDVNDIVKSGYSDIDSIINTNTYEGLAAKLKFAEWRKLIF
ncbi:DNA primase [Ochrobactrum phage vB_OspM_OC]|nr:DNA primase [Ochrobactrum phage vB_OspM_OC]